VLVVIRRRPGRALAVTVVVLLVLVLIAVLGVGWYFSGVALAVDHSPYLPETATVIPGGQVRISRDGDSDIPGIYGLAWGRGGDAGYGQVGEITSRDATTVTRPFTLLKGRPPHGSPADVDPSRWSGDPSDVGLQFRNVTVRSDLGNLPTWLVPAARDDGVTWVVFIHGHDASRMESLRYLTRWHALGLPVLVPTYRDDVGAPASAGGQHALGETEWRDAAAAVGWAMAHGARDVVLAGWSMGGAISLQAVDRSPYVASHVRGLVLDSPVLDWRDVFAHQGADRGLPAPLIDVAEWFVEERSGMNLDRFDWPARAKDLKRPMLVLHGTGDSYVPGGPSVAVAKARPDLVTLVRIPGAGHTRSWNVDPARYDKAMADWLASVGALPR